MLELTFDQFAENPSGGRTHMAGERAIARSVYEDKFNKVMMKQAGFFQYYMYADPPYKYVLYLKMPSESVEEARYDVVIEFYSNDDVQHKSNKLDGYFVRLFSNDPNFTFTYAYVLHKNKMTIPALEDKLSKKSITEAPSKTNPFNTVGYIKSLYFAYLFWKYKGFNMKARWFNAPAIKNYAFKGTIMNAERKLAQVRQQKIVQNAVKKGTMLIAGDRLPVEADRAETITKANDSYKRAETSRLVNNVKRAATVKRTKRI